MKNNLSLNQKLRMIGFRIAYSEAEHQKQETTPLDYDLEETLLSAIYESQDDLRVQKILLTWIKLHGDRVLVEKFFKKLKLFETVRGECPILSLVIANAVASGHSSWKKWLKTSKKNPIYPGNKATLASSIQHKGADEKLAALGVWVPKNYLNLRDDDVYSVKELIESNFQYRNRFIYGTNWRADIITALECGLENPFQISKTLGCSYEPAHRTVKEYWLAFPEKKTA